MPMLTPTPAVLPKATDTAAATMVAWMEELLVARTVTSPTGLAAVPTVLFSMLALLRVRMTFVDSAPPPLTATPAVPPPMPADTATAAATALMRELSAAVTLTSPYTVGPLPGVKEVSMLDTSSTVDVMRLSMRLCASASPMATETALPPASATETAAAPASAKTLEVSLAATCTLPALTFLLAPLPAPLPSITAFRSTAMLFSV